jgi:hypothetical protein
MFKILFKFVLKLVEKWSKKTKTSLDDELIACLKKYINDWNN